MIFSHGERESYFSVFSFVKALIPIMRTLFSLTYTFLMSLHPITITFGGRISKYEFIVQVHSDYRIMLLF
jgi:hypothetical protein